MKPRQLLQLHLASTQNLSFNDFETLLGAFGFALDRVSGSHHIFKHPDIPELINIQKVRGQAKPYQIRQFLKLVERYNLHLEEKQ